MAQKNLWIALAIIVVTFSCQNQEKQIKSTHKIQAKTSLLDHYVAPYTSVEDVHIYNTKDGQECRLSTGLGYDTQNENNPILKNVYLRGNIDSTSFSFMLSKNPMLDPKEHLSYGLLTYEPCPLDVKFHSQANKDRIDPLSYPDGHVRLFQITSKDSLKSEICEEAIFENLRCSSKIEYSICLKAGAGLTSFTFDGVEWTYKNSIKESF